jgi:hypothetical protein
MDEKEDADADGDGDGDGYYRRSAEPFYGRVLFHYTVLVGGEEIIPQGPRSCEQQQSWEFSYWTGHVLFSIV